MRPHFFKAFLLCVFVALLGTLACDLSTFGLGSTGKPQVAIQSPPSGGQFREGEEVAIQSTASDAAGIARVELSVDGATVQTDTPPLAKQTSFTLIQKWKATNGTHTLSVRAFSSAGTASEPALITLNVAPGVATQPTMALPTTIILPPIGVASLTPPLFSTAAPVSGTVLPGAPTATLRPTVRPASPTIAAPPGVYVTSIRFDPVAPKRNQPVRFFVTFLNTMPSPQWYRWRVRVYPPDNMKNAKGDTTPLENTLVVGSSEIPSSDNWTIRGPGDCEEYFARVFWIDPGSKQETEFVKPDASGGFAAQFKICP